MFDHLSMLRFWFFLEFICEDRRIIEIIFL